MWTYLDTRYSEERILFAVFGAFFISLIATPAVREFARRKSLLDQPNQRSSHSTPVPRLGGVSIGIATAFGIVALAPESSWRIGVVLLAAIIMAGAGFYDDVRPINAFQKYAPQLTASIMTAWALRPDFELATPFVEFSLNGWSAILLAAFWITAFINAFNFMDGVDGIAGGVGIVTAMGMIVLTSGHGMFLLMPIAAALAGFLLWNISPASIFMGDGGSQVIGFLLATGALHWPAQHVNLIAVAIAFAPFLFDTGFTLVWRITNRMNVFQAHRSHLYQRLTMVGFGHRDIANLYIAASTFSVVVAVGYASSGPMGKLGLALLLVFVAVAYVTFVSRREHDSLTHPNTTTRKLHESQRRGARL